MMLAEAARRYEEIYARDPLSSYYYDIDEVCEHAEFICDHCGGQSCKCGWCEESMDPCRNFEAHKKLLREKRVEELQKKLGEASENLARVAGDLNSEKAKA